MDIETSIWALTETLSPLGQPLINAN